MLPAHVRSVNISSGGVPKRSVESCEVGLGGLSGDRQRDLRYHGGPDRAVCLYSFDLVAALRREGHPIEVGTIGENVSVSGLVWPDLMPGTRLRVGAVELQVTAYAHPCRKIAGSFRDARFERVSQKVHPGWSRLYARVTTPGRIAAGDAVQTL
jgi:MOSC domain-containing protein YiiM